VVHLKRSVLAFRMPSLYLILSSNINLYSTIILRYLFSIITANIFRRFVDTVLKWYSNLNRNGEINSKFIRLPYFTKCYTTLTRCPDFSQNHFLQIFWVHKNIIWKGFYVQGLWITMMYTYKLNVYATTRTINDGMMNKVYYILKTKGTG